MTETNHESHAFDFRKGGAQGAPKAKAKKASPKKAIAAAPAAPGANALTAAARKKSAASTWGEEE